MTYHFRSWHIASFRCDAKFGRYGGITDIAQLAAGSTQSRMTKAGIGSQRWEPIVGFSPVTRC